ncbi:Porin subfamily protein [Rhizobiales bacterium GAS188]|nr:Porin subfamily protein [Rhizobiales bacterium GAS188]
MKLVKSLLLGSAAGVVAAVGVQAADLPTRKAAPVDYVRICAVHGPGFFYIPGSDTCIRLSGRARFEYVYEQTYAKNSDPSGFRAMGRLAIDARTQTDLGILRAYTRIDFTRDSGAWFGSGSGARGATRIGFGGGASGVAGSFPSYSGIDTAGNKLQTGVFVTSAFVQWGGLTAGRLQSFFDFYADSDTFFGITDSDTTTTALAYTYTFGSGFSATLSIEDPKERQRYPIAGLAPVGAGGINPSVPVAAFSAVYPFAFSPYAAPGVSSINYIQRENVPDVVGVLNVTQAWGSAQLSGAYHRIESGGSTITNLQLNNTGTAFISNPLVPTVPGGYGNKTGNGWAVQAGVKINLPMIAAGDYFYAQAAYSKGSISYVDGGFPGSYSAGAFSTTYDAMPAYDAVVGPSGHITLTPAYSGLVSLEHYWTPTIRQGIFAGAVHYSYSGATRTAAGFAAGAACPTCVGSVAFANGSVYNPFSTQYNGGTQYQVGTNLIWSPLKDLDIGVEVFYSRDQLQHKEWDLNSGNGKLTKSADLWLSRLRVSRDF